ncbi:hypothetical protein OESDEN_02274 [Oesophagostomum dentatum]|uniref:Uncharacterized protein n=1 Tax=Oesophagostomum dentatum TaxID=61180 RepID=A0A0B1TNS5_OESDE|nr:hypothetical protein OESDEN_02274 [Oesophagostomum dentatum]
MVDRERITHKCQLFDSSVITTKVNKPQLTKEDLQYTEERSIQLSSVPEHHDKPRVLLGYEYLWEVVKGGKLRLPSGLHLINTKFGYMVSGKKKPSSAEEENANVLQTEASKGEQDIWDNYWKTESSGTNEYIGTEKNEKIMTDEEVMKEFKETTVKRPDGHHVRLPWKKPRDHLPDNKRMAVARLKALLRQYEDRREFLQEFERIFKEQLQQGVIEEVTEDMERKGNNRIIHYHGYQAVVTPEKKTTP